MGDAALHEQSFEFGDPVHPLAAQDFNFNFEGCEELTVSETDALVFSQGEAHRVMEERS